LPLQLIRKAIDVDALLILPNNFSVVFKNSLDERLAVRRAASLECFPRSVNEISHVPWRLISR
jgi:hypothetical protein